MLRCQYAILGEHIRAGQRNTFDILGVFDRIFAGQLPAQHRHMALVILLVAETEDDLGKHTYRFTCTAPSGRLVLEQRSSLVVKPEGGTWLGSARLLFQFENTPILETGKYRFEVTVGDVVVATHLMTVVHQSQAS